MVRVSRGDLVYHGLNEMDNLVFSNVTSGRNEITAIDYDYASRQVFWTFNHYQHGYVFAGDLGGMSRRKRLIHKSFCTIEIITMDWIHENLYFTCFQSDSIEVISLVKPDKHIRIANVAMLKILLIDPSEKYLFWATFNRIERAELNGVNRTLLLSLSERLMITRMTLDLVEKRLFYMISGENAIYSFDYNGQRIRSFRIFTFDKAWNNVFSVIGEYIYLPFNDHLRRIDKRGVRRMSKQVGKVSIKGAIIAFPALQPDGFNNCFLHNCNASCLPNRSNVTCL